MRWRDLQPGDLYVDGAWNVGYLVLSSSKTGVTLLMVWGPNGSDALNKLSTVTRIDDRIPVMYNSQVWRNGRTINGY